MKLAFITVCSPRPEEFAEILSKCFGGSFVASSAYWILNIPDLPEIRVLAGNAEDSETHHLGLTGPKEELLYKILEIAPMPGILQHEGGFDFFKIYNATGCYVGSVSVASE